MECCSRPTLGIIIGIVNILIYIGVCFGMTIIYKDSQNKSDKLKIIAGLIITVSLIMIVISGLLIFGIFKRLHKFLWPWLAVSGLLFICSCGRALFDLAIGLKNYTPFATLMWTLVIDLLALGIQALIIWPIYTLYEDIGSEMN